MGFIHWVVTVAMLISPRVGPSSLIILPVRSSALWQMIHLLNMLFPTSQAVQFPESYWNLSSYRWFSNSNLHFEWMFLYFPTLSTVISRGFPLDVFPCAERLDPLERVLNFHHSIGSHRDGRTSGDISNMTSGQGRNLQQISLLCALYIYIVYIYMLYVYTYIYIL